MSQFTKNINKFKEKLSFSYLEAICAKNGIIFEPRKYDNDGIDGYLIIYDEENIKHEIDIQLKSTENDSTTVKHFKYSVKAKNHNDLCNNMYKPNILLVLHLNKDVEEWVKLNEDELLIRHIMYYYDYIDEAETRNDYNVNINIPMDNIVNPENFYEKLLTIHKNWVKRLYSGGVGNE